MNSPLIKLLSGYVEQTCWFLFLIWLILASLASAPYNSISWMLLSCLLYGLSVVYLASVASGAAYNIKALKRCFIIIVIAALSLFWLYAQTVLPVSNELFQTLDPSSSAAAWLQPHTRISVDQGRTLWLLYSYIPAFICMLLACAMVFSRTRVKQFLYLFIFLFLLHAAAGIYAKYAGHYLIDKDQLDGHWSAVRGWFINRNHYAAFILANMIGVLSFVIYCARRGGNALTKLALMAALIISFVAIILSQSRAGLICWAVVMLSTCFTTIYRHKFSKAKGADKYPLVYIALCALIFTIAGVIFGADLWARLVQSSLSLGERGLQWQITWSAIKLSPWFGYGGGSYAQVFQQFRDYAELRQVVFDQSHNHYLHLLLEQGLIGLALWLGLIVLVAARAITTIQKSKSQLVVSVTIAAGLALAAALLQSLVDFNLQIINLRCFFFVIIGLILALPTARNNQGI